MIDFGPHAVFIIWSYLGTALVVALLIGWTAYGARTQKKRLADLQKRGISRRSASPSNSGDR